MEKLAWTRDRNPNGKMMQKLVWGNGAPKGHLHIHHLSLDGEYTLCGIYIYPKWPERPATDEDFLNLSEPEQCQRCAASKYWSTR
jgi:hypothetical protein